jgi:hypothetical protein
MQLKSRTMTTALATGAIALSGVGVAWACGGSGQGPGGHGPTGASGPTGTTGSSAAVRHARRHGRLRHRHVTHGSRNT